MLTQYKNTDLFKKNGPDYGKRFNSTDDQLLSKSVTISPDVYNLPSVELHVYSNTTWLTGNHSVSISKTSNASSEIQPVTIDISKTIKDLRLTTGKFNIVVNFFENIIGSYTDPTLYIDDISPDRTEARIRLTLSANKESVNQFVKYTDTYDARPQTDVDAFKLYSQYILNFGRNKTYAYTNSVVIGKFLYLKFLEPLPVDIQKNFKCWVVKEIKAPYFDTVILETNIKKNLPNSLSGPNFDVTVNSNFSSDTELKNWNDLLGTSIQTSQQIVDKFFSGSLDGTPLNIDFRDFNNFIFYSSAEERLRNFKYKLELLEYYNNQIIILNNTSGSTATTNAVDYTTNKTKLISGFDAFEKYLYYESSSLLYNNDIPAINPAVASITGSYIFPSPKLNSTKPYTLYNTTSSVFINWFDTLIETASLYDSLNINRLINYLPQAIQLDENNDQLFTFVNMLGHHYDILQSYIKHGTLKYKHEENPKIGMPDELLFNVAKQFGWDLVEGNQYQELWQYTLGTDAEGTPLTGSLSVGDPSVAGSNMTRMVWRRIVNNLPLLLKSKGTKRSVQALLACYGIPQSMISINEYGGPRIERVPVYEKTNFDYALDLINNAAGTVTINYNTPIDGLELRFRTDDVVSNPLLPSAMNLVTIGSNTISLHFDSGNMGKVKINGTASSNIELYDGAWLNLLLQKNGTNLDLFVKKSKYGKIVATVSSSATASFATSGTITIGGTTGGSRLYGQVQELRLWTGSLDLNAFANHTKAPSAYDGTTDAYEELIFRLPLTQKVNHALTSSLTGVQPRSSSISASFSSWTNNTPYDSIDEIHYFDGVSFAAGTMDDNKVRIESSELSSNKLQLLKRVEVSQYDSAPLDSNKLGVYFSPQTMINEDIIAQLGFLELDSYIGDPGDNEKDSYPLLHREANRYWKKYDTKNDMNSYIRIFTMFDLSFFKQLEQLLPARAEKVTGLLIQPNLLERNRHTFLPQLSTWTGSLDMPLQKLAPDPQSNINNNIQAPLLSNINIASSTVTPMIVSSVSAAPLTNNTINVSSLTSFLTSSNEQKYDSTIYIRPYLLKSPKYTYEYIESETPPWLGTNGFIQPITDSINDELLQSIQTFYSGGIEYTITSSAKVNPILTAGLQNSFYNGSKMTSADFNIGSPDTYLGRPVVEIKTVNANSITVNPYVTATDAMLVGGAKAKDTSETVNKDTATVIHPDAQVD